MKDLYEIDSSYHYVYEHWIDDEVIYVGKGKGDRAFQPYRNAYWSEETKDRINELDIIIKGYFENEEDALEYEEMLMLKYADEGFNLTNVRSNSSTHFDIEEQMKKAFFSKYKIKKEGEEIPLVKVRNINHAINLILQSKDKVVIFTNKPFNLTTKLEDGRCKVLNIANSESEKTDELIAFRETGLIPKGYDVILLPARNNSFMEIIDDEVGMVMFDNISRRECKESFDTVKTKRIPVVVHRSLKYPSNESINYLNITEDMLNVNLDAKDKRDIVDKLNIYNSIGRKMKWISIKKMLIKEGYSIEEKTIRVNKIQKRVSVIRRKSNDVIKEFSTFSNESIVIPETMLNFNLDTSYKKEIMDKLNICNHETGKRLGWVSIKKLLIAEGYSIEEKTIRENGIQKRVSVVTKPETK